MRTPFLLCILGFLCFTLSAYSQNPTNSQRLKQLPQGHKLRANFEQLTPQAKLRAENWLNQLDKLPREDFNTIELDKKGGVFYVENVISEASTAVENAPEIQEITLADVFTLHSKPGASKVVHLDFDGHNITGTIWNNSAGRTTLYALPYNTDGNVGSFNTSEVNAMAAMWHRVAEDFAPFDIDVTTESPAGGYGPNVGHILVTHRTDAEGFNLYENSAGGVAYVNVWGGSNFPYYQPALVFYNHLGNGNIHYTAEAASHELGHNLGLSHDGTSVESYYGGHGSGNIGWAPIMGVGYYQEVTQWSNGNYADANNTQDDLNIISNKLGYSVDDHGNSISNATELVIESNGTVNVTNPENDPENLNTSNKGIIETSDDLDVFSFTTSGGQVTINIIPSWAAYNVGLHRGSNLDIKAVLYDNLGGTLGTYSISNDTYVSISENLGTGTYFISIEGEGSSNYNDYASIGQYFISGTIEGVVPANENPVASFTADITDRTVTFTDSSTDNDGTIASWSWDFGDGNTSTQQNPVHTYGSDNDFSVSLTVTDNLGAINSITQLVSICLDSDGDGVCDDNDICADGDDTIDTDGDGIPDSCDSCNDLIDTDNDGVSDCIDQEINSPCPNNVDANGVSLDSDGDGVCDDNDVCNGNDDTLDADADGIPDGCDACPNSASGDSDGDGVCDDLDICPNGDDNIDTDGDGIPDACDDSCVPNTTSFDITTLAHSGSGSNSTSVTFPTNSQGVSFTITGFDENISGKPTGRYIEQVNITYVNGQGNNQNYGTFSGSNLVAVNISGFVQSLTVSLTDGYDGNSPTNMSVNLSTIDFCVETVLCNDSDNDGICDSDDQCPGFDDNLDSDGDGISDCVDLEPNSPCPDNVDSDGLSLDSDGDGVCDDLDVCPGGDDSIDENGNGVPDSCDVPPCDAQTTSFSQGTLTHSGAGSSNISVSIPANGQDISFTISDMDEVVNGKPDNRYSEAVTVTYIDGQGANQNYGTFTGNGAVSIDISGLVQSVTVSLADGYDGTALVQLSVNLSLVNFCVQSGAASLSDADSSIASQSIKVYPNPASNDINVLLHGYHNIEAQVVLYNFRGQMVMNKNINGSENHLELVNVPSGLYMLLINDNQGNVLARKRIIINK